MNQLPPKACAVTTPCQRRRYTLAALTLIMMFAFTSTASALGLNINGNLISMSNGSTAFDVWSVLPGGLASRVGIIPGDAIVSINGYPPGNAAINQQAIAMGHGHLEIKLYRRGRKLTLGNAATRYRPSPPVHSTHYCPVSHPIRPRSLGIDTDVLHYGDRVHIEVVQAFAGGAGRRMGLRDGDIIERVNGYPIPSYAKFAQVIRNSNMPLKLYVRNRITQRRHVVDIY